ncbi:MAG: DMT family transporter [Rhodospirillaceae bacterium]
MTIRQLVPPLAPPLEPQRSATRLAIFLVVSGYVLASTSDSAVKWVSGDYPVAEVLFFSALFALVPLSIAIVVGGGWTILATRRLPLHLLRASIGLAGYFFGIYALGHMPLADFYAAVFTAPLFMTALSVPITGERVERSCWLAVAIGFAGVVVMARPGSGLAGYGTLAALCGSLCYALGVLLVRRMGGTEKAVSFSFYGVAMMLAGAGAVMAPVFVIPTWPDLSVMALAGVSMGCFQLCAFAAFRRAPTAVLAPFQYLQMIWGVMIGLLVFGEHPGGAVAVGCVLVVGSGLYILYCELHREHYREHYHSPPLPILAGEARVKNGGG